MGYARQSARKSVKKKYYMLKSKGLCTKCTRLSSQVECEMCKMKRKQRAELKKGGEKNDICRNRWRI